MRSTDVREKFLSFFEGVGHRRVKSSPLIPAQDPTLLFTNAGMVQFKDCFLGLQDLGFKRATTAQKCVRAGGKHNDLENVGFTPRHHTFFEMLGNFSFGDYFKKDAIAFAWELLTKHYGLPKDRLWVTVFETDDEAAKLWEAQGVRKDWIIRLGEKDNFWAMGDAGPCGPCTEIHFDWGVNRGCGKPTCAPGCPCDTRFLEIWNLVFMQYNRDASGKLAPLPKPSVDTGGGLERLSAVLQGVYSNYDSDVFQPILSAISETVKIDYGKSTDTDVSMRVIADHLRSGTFLVTDGVNPTNEGRGYVLRRILRRAIRHGKKLNQDAPFIYSLVKDVVRSLGAVYPEIAEKQKYVETIFREEEERFHQTLHRGLGLLEESLSRLGKGAHRKLPGEVVFKLYDSFGFPADLVQVICAEQQVGVDEEGFNALMEKQRGQSSWTGSKSTAAVDGILRSLEKNRPATLFTGYDRVSDKGTVVRLWDSSGQEAEQLTGEGFFLADVTPFYAESGGQVGDTGVVSSASTRGRILDTKKWGGVTVHMVTIDSGALKVGETVELSVNADLRKKTAINHTATHLLHAALRKVLGDRVKQAGSLVDSGRLRFDFAYPRGVTRDEIATIEGMVNREIRAGLPVKTEEMGYDQAVKSGALAFFEDKYGDRVRVVRVGGESPFSVELCGGTHLSTISDVGVVKVVAESSVASGVRRIEAITGEAALSRLMDHDRLVETMEAKLGVKAPELPDRIDQLAGEIKHLRKEIDKLKLTVAQGGQGSAPWDRKVTVRDLQVVIERVPGANPGVLRTLADQIRDKLKERVLVVLASENEGKVSLCVGLSKDLVGRLDAGKMIKPLAQAVGGTGGGRPDFAQAGGSNPGGIESAFAQFRQSIEKQDPA
ncbi:MAG: alanine--tRNA ligase [Deltaproteobacteria bacterium]|nr:alanine--tRNA ligase [Deltaproteobacteria bacterium]